MDSADAGGGEPLHLRRTAAVVGFEGPVITDRERALFAKTRPTGFILFARNCVDPRQVSALIQACRAAVEDPAAPVLIDQEGGRVARLKPPHWQTLPPLRLIGRLAEHDLEAGRQAAWLHARLIATDLEPLGITVNCSPVLDLGLEGQTSAIGDRAFSNDPGLVAALGRATIEGYLAGGILPVIKHLPGHGRARVDSHTDLPLVDCAEVELADLDWRPFVANADAPFAMTAHILFSQLDSNACGTQSPTVIQDIIREKIGFAGALFSDDLSMEALGGSLGERADLARRAGCDLALHCNGDFEEMSAVLEASGPLEGESLLRVERGLARQNVPEPFDIEAGRRKLDALLGIVEPSSQAAG